MSRVRRKRAIRPNRIPLHVFTATTATDWRGELVCSCGSVKSASVHAVPETPEHVAEAEARRLGESTGDSMTEGDD